MKQNGPRILAALLLAAVGVDVHADDFAIAPAGTFPNFHWGVQIDGAAAQANPTLTLIRGRTYSFAVSGLAGVHSFYINTQNTTLTTFQYSGGGLSANGLTSDATITFTVPQDAPDTLFYNCSHHGSMAGTIMIDGIFTDGFEG
jgi:hypothetical protein